MSNPSDKSKKEDAQEVHKVDGIIELDNPAPQWWQAIFYFSIVWGIGYAAYYLFGDGLTLKEELARDMAKLERSRIVKVLSAEDQLVELKAAFSDRARLEAGKQAYLKNCASCHAADGGGGIGPNLTDKHWIHGDGGLVEIAKMVKDGFVEKGMPPWGAILKHDDQVNVTAFVRSLNGTKPAAPKAAQGEVKTPAEGT